MRAVFILADSVNRRFLNAYGAAEKAVTPNLDRLAERSVVFDNHWCGSSPCMPARRDILTGRLNFLERPWGPIEPFDATLVDGLRAGGTYTCIKTDHCHYARTGGEGYLQLFNSWELFRGQEGDPWVSRIDEPDNMPETFYGRVREQYQKNRQLWPNEEDMPSPKTFQSACDWIDGNAGADDFFLMVEAFDPHEPFDVPDKYMEMYGGTGELDRDYFEIPEYKRVSATDVNKGAEGYLQRRYKALVTMTDRWFGRLIDKLEETLEELKTREPEDKPYRVRVVVAGSEVDDTDFIKLVEDCGAYVCADRFCYGSLPGRDPIELTDDEDALTQICRQYMYRGQCPRYMNTAKMTGRREYVNELAKEYGADGIIYEQIKFCDPWAYERMMGSHILHDDYGYPVLSIDRPYNIGSTNGQLRTRVQAFVESVEIKKINGGVK